MHCWLKFRRHQWRWKYDTAYAGVDGQYAYTVRRLHCIQCGRWSGDVHEQHD